MMDHESVKVAVKEAMKEEMADFYIDRETHYKQHQWLSGLIEWTNTCKTTCGRVIVQAVCFGFIGLLVLGFIFWGSKSFKG